MNTFYVYEYYIIETGEIFYVGKGTRSRYKELRNRGKYFLSIYNKYKCAVRKIAENITNAEAIKLEIDRIAELKAINQAKANLTNGGDGFSSGLLNPTHRRNHKGTNNVFYGKSHTNETKQRISDARKGKGGKSGSDNPMYGKGFKGTDNPMYGVLGINNPTSKKYRILYTDGTTEIVHYKGCEKKFGIAFSRISIAGGTLEYKKKCKNDCYSGTIIELLD